LADDLLREYSRHELNQDLLTQDVHGCNVLHHAIRNGYKELALKLIQQQPALSESCNNHQESPMFMAVLKGFKNVYVEMLSNENSTYTGPGGYNVLHAAVKYGDRGTRLTKLQYVLNACF
jgi:ankyrin repeat protein